MIKSFYWCPYISEVATVRSVINSTKSFKKYSNETNNFGIYPKVDIRSFCYSYYYIIFFDTFKELNYVPRKLYSVGGGTKNKIW